MTATYAELVARAAAAQTKIDTIKANHGECLDTIWMMLCAMLVFFMHAGFSLLEAGSVRFKNTQNILAKNLLVVTLGFLCWYFFGYPFALGIPQNPNRFWGQTNWAMDGFMTDDSTKVNFRVWFFQGAFCATAATIVSGAMAERTKLFGFGCFLVVVTSFIYPSVAYWGWSGQGFLNYPDSSDASTMVSFLGPSYKDFAGSGIVHMVGGVAALCGAAIVGPRKGRFTTTNDEEFDAHSVPFCVLGTFFLWFGWYGFNPGSTLAMKTKADAVSAGLVAANTMLAPCVAGLIVFFLRAKVVYPKALDVSGFCNGILAGLVSITAGCNSVKPWEAVLIGAFGGVLYQASSMILKKAQIDDVVDAVPVHGVCGAWGVIAIGFFGNPLEGHGGNGVFYGGNQLGIQILTVLIIGTWTAVMSICLFVPLNIFGQLRLSDDFQDAGADIKEHSPRKAYNEEAKPAPVPVEDDMPGPTV